MTPSFRGLPRRPGIPQVNGVLADTPTTLAVAADCTSDRGLSAAGVPSCGGLIARRIIFWERLVLEPPARTPLISD
jgi:hypothetical protein